MFKYRFFQVILAIAVVMLIVSSAVFISFQGVNISEAEYTSEMTGRTFETDGADGSETALTEFEAWLEYSIIADGLKETGNNVDFDKGNVKLCDYNLTQLRQLKKVKDEAKRMMFLSVILLIIGFLAVKKRRMYECVVWGGVAASVIGIVSLYSCCAVIGKRKAFSMVRSLEQRLQFFPDQAMQRRLVLVFRQQ